MNRLGGRRGKRRISPFHTKRVLHLLRQWPAQEAPGTNRQATKVQVLRANVKSRTSRGCNNDDGLGDPHDETENGRPCVAEQNLWLFSETILGSKKVAEACEGWCTKQQAKDEGSAHPWACSKRGAAFGCVISLLNEAAAADTRSAARTTELHPGWTKAGFSEMAKCKPAVWDSVLGSFKPIHPKHKEDKPWSWVATINSDAPSQFMEQFQAMTSLHTGGVISIAAERENKQSKSEEHLCKWLKNRSKNT